MSEDLALVVPSGEPPASDPRPGARQRLLTVIGNLAGLPGIPLPMRIIVATGRTLAEVGIRSDEDALALNHALRVLSQLMLDYVDGLQPDVEGAERVMDELARRFEGR